VNRAFWVARTFSLRAGELTGCGEDLVFLTVDEMLAVLAGDERPLAFRRVEEVGWRKSKR
jgi:pyruvate,water dikinase